MSEAPFADRRLPLAWDAAKGRYWRVAWSWLAHGRPF